MGGKRGNVFLGVLLAVLAAEAIHAETYEIDEGGSRRRFELAMDEVRVVASGRKGGRGELRRIASQRDGHAMKRYVRDMAVRPGEKAQLVLYEAGRPRSEWTRYFVTDGIVVKLGPDADIKAIAVSADGYCAGRLPFACDFAVVNIRKGNALDAAEILRMQPGVVSAEPLLDRKRSKRMVPNDTFFPQQWHLQNTAQNAGAVAGMDLNCVPAWDSATGAGVVIGILDDGLETSHTDLAGNVDLSLCYDFNEGDADPSPDPDFDYHGTACAGCAAAVGNNSKGVSGVAPQAKLAGLRMLAGEESDLVEAQSMYFSNGVIAVKSCSWGPDDFFSETVQGPGQLTEQSWIHAVTHGRGGLGTVFLFAAGNGGEDDWQTANMDGYANSIYTIAVGGVGDQGTRVAYSEKGSCVVVCAPTIDDINSRPGIWTTDLTGNAGYNPYDETISPNKSFTATFGGTSASCPLAAGAVALMLEENPGLGWRDVQEILMVSATKNDAANPGWFTNGGGLEFNHEYGAGLIDANAAVQLAGVWTNLGPQVSIAHEEDGVALAIPDNHPAGVARSHACTKEIRLEHVVLTVDIAHARRGNLQIELTSPSGTRSVMMDARPSDDTSDYDHWSMMTVHNWGESSLGTWTVKVIDTVAGTAGTLNGYKLEFFGTADDAPVVEIATQPAKVGAGTTSYVVEGSVTGNVVGNLAWRNDANGATGTIPATASWTVPSVPLVPGPNPIWIMAENSAGIPAARSVVITRTRPPLAPWFQGFETVQTELTWEPLDTWEPIDGAGAVSGYSGGYDYPIYQTIRTGLQSWQSWMIESGTPTLELAEVSVAALAGVKTLTAHLSATTYENDMLDLVGMTDGASLKVYVALDGAAYPATPDLTVRGKGSVDGARWGYDATGVASATAGVPAIFQPAAEGELADGYSTLRIAIPAGASTVKIKFVADNGGLYEPSWNIDDIALAGETGTLRLNAIKVAGGAVHLGWQGGNPFATQIVECKTNLVDAGEAWKALYIAAPGETNHVHAVPSGDTLYYRIRTQP